MSSTAFLNATSIARLLILERIGGSVSIRPGIYRAKLDDTWFDVYAVEPRISTGAAPLRALHLRATDGSVEELLQLESFLRASNGPLVLEDRDGQTLTVSFERSRATLYLYGEFRGERAAAEVDVCIEADGGEVCAVASDAVREGRRTLVLSELSWENARLLARSFREHGRLCVRDSSSIEHVDAVSDPTKEIPLPLLIEVFARAVATHHRLEGEPFRRLASELQGQMQSLLKRFELRVTEERKRVQTSAQLEQLLDGVARTHTAAGEIIAAHRETIAHAFRDVELAQMSAGIAALSTWLRSPEDGTNRIQSLLDQLYEVMGVTPAKDLERSR